MDLKSYRDFTVWQKSMDLATEIYRVVKLLPKAETYALSDQMRRSAVSIPSNIAEGQGRNSKREFINFLGFASGSQRELETQLQLCVKVGYMTEEEIFSAMNLCEEVGKMLSTLRKKLKDSLEQSEY